MDLYTMTSIVGNRGLLQHGEETPQEFRCMRTIVAPAYNEKNTFANHEAAMGCSAPDRPSAEPMLSRPQ